MDPLLKESVLKLFDKIAADKFSLNSVNQIQLLFKEIASYVLIANIYIGKTLILSVFIDYHLQEDIDSVFSRSIRDNLLLSFFKRVFPQFNPSQCTSYHINNTTLPLPHRYLSLNSFSSDLYVVELSL